MAGSRIFLAMLEIMNEIDKRVDANKFNQVVVFSIDERQCALPLVTVDRIVRVVEVTPLPKAPQIVLGIINVQGRIIPVINVRKRFLLPEREMELSDQLIIAHTSKRNIALLVEAVSGVIEYPEHEVVTPDEIISGIEYVEGVIKQNDGMIQILDIETILSFEELKSIEDGMIEISGGKNDSRHF